MSTPQKRSRTDVVQEGISADEILKVVREIRDLDMRPKDRTREVQQKYPDFVERYPMLFEMACQDTFDMERFEYMIRLKEDIEKRRTTVEAASKEVGQKMFDEYVKPNLQ